MQDSADDNEWMCPHNIDHGIPSKPTQMICADDCVLMAAPNIIHAGLEFDQVFEVFPTIGGPVHATNNATHPEPAYCAGAGELFESCQHPVLIESTFLKVSVGAGTQIELAALLRFRSIDPLRGQPLKVFGARIRIHDMNCSVAAFESVLDEGKQNRVLFLITVEQRTNMTYRIELRTCERY